MDCASTGIGVATLVVAVVPTTGVEVEVLVGWGSVDVVLGPGVVDMLVPGVVSVTAVSGGGVVVVAAVMEVIVGGVVVVPGAVSVTTVSGDGVLVVVVIIAVVASGVVVVPGTVSGIVVVSGNGWVVVVVSTEIAMVVVAVGALVVVLVVASWVLVGYVVLVGGCGVGLLVVVSGDVVLVVASIGIAVVVVSRGVVVAVGVVVLYLMVVVATGVVVPSWVVYTVVVGITHVSGWVGPIETDHCEHGLQAFLMMRHTVAFVSPLVSDPGLHGIQCSSDENCPIPRNVELLNVSIGQTHVLFNTDARSPVGIVTGQIEHDSAIAPEIVSSAHVTHSAKYACVPGLHATHVCINPESSANPAGQVVQLTVPVTFVTDPGKHTAHVVLGVGELADICVPLGQGVHASTAPDVSENEPGKHTAQAMGERVRSRNSPIGQGIHPVPASVTPVTPSVESPYGQAWQCDKDTPPTEPANVFSGHEAQLLLYPSSNVPTGHGSQLKRFGANSPLLQRTHCTPPVSSDTSCVG